VAAEPAAQPFGGLGGFLTLAGPVVALFAIYAVHRLTQIRDREKSVYDLHSDIADAASALATTVMTAWEEKGDAKRNAAIAQAKWRLQQLGGLVERLRKRSKRLKWRWGWPACGYGTISLTDDMGLLRDTITDDPFEDFSRGPVKDKNEEVEQAIGTFLLALDEALLGWMD
jgi:hypothetical protein